jgi:hypothetical protein
VCVHSSGVLIIIDIQNITCLLRRHCYCKNTITRRALQLVSLLRKFEAVFSILFGFWLCLIDTQLLFQGGCEKVDGCLSSGEKKRSQAL